jgi:hypothetical protein
MMKARITGIALLLVVCLEGAAVAQSSGNFAADVAKTQCVLDSQNGELSGGIAGNLLTATIKTPNSPGTALLITPSLVTGLYTNTFIDRAKELSNQTASVVVRVTLDDHPVLPATEENPFVTYDTRFQQISTQVFEAIDECSNDNPECNFDVILSTLSAHSFNFIAPNPGVGDHTLKVEWAFLCDDGSGEPSAEKCSDQFGPNTAAACAGPGTVTIQQVKVFSQSSGVTVR